MRKAAIAIAFAALLVASGCGKTGEQQAANVNGSVITDKDVVTELKAIAANTELVNRLEENGTKISGTTKGSFDPSFAAQVIANQMNNELVRQEVVRRGLQISDDCVTKARNDTLADFANGTPSEGESPFNQFPKEYQDSVVMRRANVLALQNDLVHRVCGSPDAAATYYKNNPDQFAQTCLSLISAADDATATEVVNRARAGEDFAALAQQYSTDEQSKANGGDIGCSLPSELPSSLSASVIAAKPGDVLDPVTTGIGPTIFKVRSKDVTPLDQVEQQAEELADRDLVKVFSTWLQDAQTAAKVTVDPRYGTFDQATFVITAPGGNASTSTTVAPESTINLSP